MPAIGAVAAQFSGKADMQPYPTSQRSSLQLDSVGTALKVNAMKRGGHRADRARPALTARSAPKAPGVQRQVTQYG